jgi:hypothetical protein
MVETKVFHARAGGSAYHHGSRYVVGGNSPSFSEVASGFRRKEIHSEKPNFAIDSSGRRHEIHLNVSTLDRDQDSGNLPFTVVKKKAFKEHVPKLLNFRGSKAMNSVNGFKITRNGPSVPMAQRTKLMNATIDKKHGDREVIKICKSKSPIVARVKSSIHGRRKTRSNFDLDTTDVESSRGLAKAMGVKQAVFESNKPLFPTKLPPSNTRGGQLFKQNVIRETHPRHERTKRNTDTLDMKTIRRETMQPVTKTMISGTHSITRPKTFESK